MQEANTTAANSIVGVREKSLLSAARESAREVCEVASVTTFYDVECRPREGRIASRNEGLSVIGDDRSNNEYNTSFTYIYI